MQDNDVAAFKSRVEKLQLFRKHCMIEGIDYGTIVGKRPVLLKPGAEKLLLWSRLYPRTSQVESVLDWTGANHEGEPFFYFNISVALYDDSGKEVANCQGNANSWEAKYRYRWLKDIDIPEGINIETLQKRTAVSTDWAFAIEKAETSGKYGKPQSYWDKFTLAIAADEAKIFQKEASWKKGKNPSTETAVQIVDHLYRCLNPEQSDIVNTVAKIAQKRSLVGVTLIGTMSSGAFTQDLEDMSLGDIQEWRPGWKEFYNRVIPGIPKLLKAVESLDDKANLIGKLLKDKYDMGTSWDSALATSAHTYLLKLEEQVDNSESIVE